MQISLHMPCALQMKMRSMHEPETYKKVVSYDHRKQWISGMETEIKSLNKKKTWILAS